jgi:hypothetical protein
VPGKTFHWAGEYEVNMNNRRTLATELGVFEALRRLYRLTAKVRLFSWRTSRRLSESCAGSNAPGEIRGRRYDGPWLNIALKDLLRLLRRIDAFVLKTAKRAN